MVQPLRIYTDPSVSADGSVLVAEKTAAEWYAVHTRSHFEIKTFAQLSAKSFQTFLPKITVMSRRRDRRKKISIPMFPGYLFVHVRLTPEHHLDIVKCAGVVRLVGQNGRPVPVNPEEIANLTILDGVDLPVEHCRRLIRGDRVMIVDGPLKGLTGAFMYRKDNIGKLVVSVDFLQTAVSVEVDAWSIEPIG